MANGRISYPSVFVVDSGTSFPPPLPPKPGQMRIHRRRKDLFQNIVLVLVGLTLFGLLVEGCFIYTLHKDKGHESPNKSADPVNTPKSEKLKGDRPERKPKPLAVPLPSKPLAHLTAGDKKPEKSGTIAWHSENSILYELKYRDGALIVQKEGYYYVYSKLSYRAEDISFIQTVKVNTTRLPGRSINLLNYNRHDPKPPHTGTVRDSFLAGVFHLYKDDAVFVDVKNGYLIRLYQSADNFFGMFML